MGQACKTKARFRQSLAEIEVFVAAVTAGCAPHLFGLRTLQLSAVPHTVRATEIPKHILGTNLREYRKSHGISQMALAEELSLDQRYYSDIERGEWNLTFETVGGIADKTGIHPLKLLSADAPFG